MTDENHPEIEDTGLTEDDYDQHFLVSTRQLIIVLLSILGILGSALFWFHTTMRANSNKKITQARKILKRAEKLPGEPTPLTLELERFGRETDDERNWILKELSADSFAETFDKRLKDRFLRQTTYLELPSDWRNRLPPKLDRWATQRRNQRKREIRSFLEKLKTTFNEIEHRLSRVETLRKQKNLQSGSFGGDIRRYESLKTTLRNEMNQVRRQLESNSVTAPDLPTTLFNHINDLVDPLTHLAMHFRNFSAFTSAPAAYYHADRLLHDALRIDPGNPAAYYLLGKLYRKLGLHNIASEHIVRALRHDPDYKREEILKQFRQRLQKSPRNPRRNYDLAFALHETGQPDRATKYLKKVLQLQQGKHSMVKVLARKRLRYIRTGEPTYSKLTLF